MNDWYLCICSWNRNSGWSYQAPVSQEFQLLSRLCAQSLKSFHGRICNSKNLACVACAVRKRLVRHLFIISTKWPKRRVIYLRNFHRKANVLVVVLTERYETNTTRAFRQSKASESHPNLERRLRASIRKYTIAPSLRTMGVASQPNWAVSRRIVTFPKWVS